MAKASTVRGRYEGNGFLEDHDPSTMPNVIPSGGEFTTSSERFEALKAQGIRVVEVEPEKAPAPSNPKVVKP